MSGQTRHSLKAEALGPFSDAAQQRVLQIYYYIQDWRGDSTLDPWKWGWQLTKRGIMPIEMNKQVAPPELLKIVKCGCKTDSLRKNCTLRQYGDVCTNIYLGCTGVPRKNCKPINDTDLWQKHNLNNFYPLANQINSNILNRGIFRFLTRF